MARIFSLTDKKWRKTEKRTDRIVETGKTSLSEDVLEAISNSGDLSIINAFLTWLNHIPRIQLNKNVAQGIWHSFLDYVWCMQQDQVGATSCDAMLGNEGGRDRVSIKPF